MTGVQTCALPISFGKPYVVLHGKAKEAAEKKGIQRIEVSISDTREYAMAFAVGEGEKA